jgi:DNA mismatch endonuclease, patch repair protein
MVDNLRRAQRRHAMRQVRSRDTTPEVFVRRVLRSLGFGGYRLHRRELPGNPDVAWIGRKQALFVHGCFWHGHHCRRGKRRPATNSAYWSAKILRNRTRDSRARAQLRKSGWRVAVVWECELRDAARLERRLRAHLE